MSRHTFCAFICHHAFKVIRDQKYVYIPIQKPEALVKVGSLEIVFFMKSRSTTCGRQVRKQHVASRRLIIVWPVAI